MRLFVGPGREVILVKESTLRLPSPFFNAALKGCWQKSSKRMILLPEDSPEVVALYVRTLDSGYGGLKKEHLVLSSRRIK